MAAHPKHAHLPQGRAPGPQSERRKSNRRFGLAFLLAGAVAGLVVTGLLFAGAIENDDPSTTGLILLVLSVFFGLLALLVWRLGAPGKGLSHLALAPSASEYSRGQTVQARLRGGDATKVATKTEVGLVCTEYYDAEIPAARGTQRATHEATAWESWQRIDPAQPIQEFAFSLPADVPFSHEGDAISYAWRLSAREDRNARLDPRTDQPVWVNP